MPDGRTNLYAMYRACERLGLRPPGIREGWDENDLETQAMILAYSQIREDEDAKIESNRIAASIGSRAFS